MEYSIDNSEEKRKADNQILNYDKEIEKVEEQIDIEQNKIQELSDMQESVDEIVDNINKCIELLSKSIKGPTTENMFSEMYATNKNFQTNVSTNIENNQIETRKRLNELYKEKESIFEENRTKTKDGEFKNNNEKE